MRLLETFADLLCILQTFYDNVLCNVYFYLQQFVYIMMCYDRFSYDMTKYHPDIVRSLMQQKCG